MCQESLGRLIRATRPGLLTALVSVVTQQVNLIGLRARGGSSVASQILSLHEHSLSVPLAPLLPLLMRRNGHCHVSGDLETTLLARGTAPLVARGPVREAPNGRSH